MKNYNISTGGSLGNAQTSISMGSPASDVNYKWNVLTFINIQKFSMKNIPLKPSQRGGSFKLLKSDSGDQAKMW